MKGDERKCCTSNNKTLQFDFHLSVRYLFLVFFFRSNHSIEFGRLIYRKWKNIEELSKLAPFLIVPTSMCVVRLQIKALELKLQSIHFKYFHKMFSLFLSSKNRITQLWIDIDSQLQWILIKHEMNARSTTTTLCYTCICTSKYISSDI